MKRQLSFIGSLLGTCFTGFHSLIVLIGFFVMISSDPLSAFIWLLFNSPIIVSLIFNILMIIKSRQSEEVYYSKKAIVITAIVFNLVCVLISFLSTGFFNIIVIPQLSIYMYISSAIVVGVFYLVDYCNVRKMFVPQNSYNQPMQAQNFNQPMQQVQPEQPVVSDLDTKLDKLNSLKEQGLITEEEYNKIKQSYIKEELGK